MYALGMGNGLAWYGAEFAFDSKCNGSISRNLITPTYTLGYVYMCLGIWLIAAVVHLINVSKFLSVP